MIETLIGLCAVGFSIWLLSYSIRGTIGMLALAACMLAPPSANACQRCGIFGRGCRFQSQHVQHVPHVAYAPPSTTQNFIFNNSYPVPFIAGNSVYGYSLAAQAYTLDPAQVLDRSARLTEVFASSAARAMSDHSGTVQGALQLHAAADRHTRNTLLALSAIDSGRESGEPASLSFRAMVTNGKLSVERLEAPQASPSNCPDCLPPPAPQDFQGRLSLSAGNLTSCATCHDGSGKKHTPVGLVIDGQTALTAEQYAAAVKAVMTGVMPPKTTLSDEQKLVTIAELARLAQ